MTIRGNNNYKSGSDPANRANFDGSVSPEYNGATATTNEHYNTNTDDDNIPIVPAYPVSDEEEVRYSSQQQQNFSNSLMPTATPTLGSSSGTAHHGHHHSHNTPEQSQGIGHATAATTSATGHHQYPAPPPHSHSHGRRSAGCLICGSIAVTSAVVFCLCCIVPVIIVMAAVRQSGSMMQNGNAWDDDFANAAVGFGDDGMTNGTPANFQDDIYLSYNGTN